MRRLFLGLGLAVFFFAMPVQAALPRCASEAERQAMLVRGLQSYLMMAGVGCNQAQAYNKFVTANQTQISSHGQILKSYFSRVYGGSGEKHLNDFITEVANAWSKQHMANMSGYCKATWELMWNLERHPAKLPELAQKVVQQPMVLDTMCSGAATATQVATNQPKP